MGMEPGPSRPRKSPPPQNFQNAPVRQPKQPEHGHRAINHRIHPGGRQRDARRVGQKRTQSGAFFGIVLGHPPAAVTQPILQIAQDAGIAVDFPMQEHQGKENKIEDQPIAAGQRPAQNHDRQNGDMDQKTCPAQRVAIVFMIQA